MPTKAELNFLQMWRGCSERGALKTFKVTNWNDDHGLPTGHWDHSTWLAWQLLSDGGRMQCLSGIGLDLVASADAAGLLPEHADGCEPVQQAPKCGTCGDTGEVFLIGSFANPCGDCPVEAVVPPATVQRVRDAVARITSAAEQPRASDGCETVHELALKISNWIGRRVRCVNRAAGKYSIYEGVEGVVMDVKVNMTHESASVTMRDSGHVQSYLCFYLEPKPGLSWMDLELAD